MERFYLPSFFAQKMLCVPVLRIFLGDVFMNRHFYHFK